MIVYKKARIMRKNGYYFDDVIVKMEVDKKKVVVPNTVPGDDKKMRAAKGKVLRISNLRNDKTYKKCQSARFGRASHLEYIVGKIAKADGLDAHDVPVWPVELALLRRDECDRGSEGSTAEDGAEFVPGPH